MNITETVGKLGLQLIVRLPKGQDKTFSVYDDRGVLCGTDAPVGAVARRPATTRRARESYYFVSFLRRPDVNFC